VLKIARISLLIPILLLGTIVAPNVIHLAHAGTGEACLADPGTANSSTPCPTTVPIFSGPVGQQIRIGAQAHLERFYNEFGFARSSEPYDEDGILHIEMEHKS